MTLHEKIEMIKYNLDLIANDTAKRITKQEKLFLDCTYKQAEYLVNGIPEKCLSCKEILK